VSLVVSADTLLLLALTAPTTLLLLALSADLGTQAPVPRTWVTCRTLAGHRGGPSRRGQVLVDIDDHGIALRLRRGTLQIV
jgi:hypothetical protein